MNSKILHSKPKYKNQVRMRLIIFIMAISDYNAFMPYYASFSIGKKEPIANKSEERNRESWVGEGQQT
jgi:hypothetical protein